MPNIEDSPIIAALKRLRLDAYLLRGFVSVEGDESIRLYLCEDQLVSLSESQYLAIMKTDVILCDQPKGLEPARILVNRGATVTFGGGTNVIEELLSGELIEKFPGLRPTYTKGHNCP